MDLALILNNLVKKSHRLKTLITANHLANQYDALLIDSTVGDFSITLPSNPMIGSRIPIFDVGGTLSTHPVTLIGNGVNINDSATVDLTGDYSFYEIIYYNPSTGWRLVLSPESNGSDFVSTIVNEVINTPGVGGGSYSEVLVDNTPELIFNNDGDVVTTVI